MTSPSKVLLLGVNSFTGRHLKPFLESRGYDVYGTTFEKSADGKSFKVDLEDQSQIRVALEEVKPDYIINLIAISFVAEEEREVFYRVNVIGTENVLQAIDASGLSVKKILLPSSAVVYGDQESHLLSEKMTPNPKNHYGYSKLISEQIAARYFDRLNIILPRPFNYTGLWQAEKFLVPKIVSAYVNENESIALGNIDTYREFNNVRFVCEAYERLLTSDVSSEIVNICSGKAYSARQILETMDRITGSKMIVKQDERFIRKNEIKELKGNPEKLHKMIGDISEEYTLEELLRTIYTQMKALA